MSLEDMSYEDREMSKLAYQLNQNPSTRSEFLKLTRQVRPDVAMPELEIEERTNRALQQAEARVASLEAKLQERDAINDLENRRKNLMDKGMVQSRAEIQQVEKLMLEKNIVDHETAAEYHNFMKQAAVPTPSGYNPNPMKQFDLKPYHKNPIQAARDMAAQALGEYRKPVRPIGL
jgi:hypothetical protein